MTRKITMKTKGKWMAALALSLMLAAAGVLAAGKDGRHFANAQRYFDDRDLNAAVIELKNTLQINPSHAEARRLLGRIYLQQKNGESAEKELERARRLGFDDVALGLDLAEAYILQNRFDDALELLPEEPEGDAEARARSHYLRGVALLGKGDREGARNKLSRSAEVRDDYLDPRFALVQLDALEGKQDAALARVQALSEKYPENTQVLSGLADLQRASGNHAAAIDTYSRALALDDSLIGALVGRATSYLALARPDEAEPDLERAEAINPELVMVSYLQGLKAFQRKNLPAAKQYLQEVITAFPKHPQSTFLYGVVNYGINEFALADEYLSRYLETDQGNLKAAKLAAAARIKLKEPGRAILLLEPFAATHDSDAQLLAILGSAHLMRGENDKGAALMQRAVELDPERAALRTQLAMGFLAEGKTDEAVSQLESAVELGQDLIHADVLLVLSHLKKQEFAKALDISRSLEKRMPDNPVAFNLSGLTYLAKGEVEQAEKSFRKALSVDPEFVTAELNLAKLDLGRKDLAAAEQHYQRILESTPGNLSALLGLAGIAESRGDAELMLQRLDQAGELNPESVQPGVLIVRQHLRSGDQLKALDSANELVRRFPNDPSALNVLGQAQFLAGESNNAARTFEQLVKVRPAMAQAHYYLAGARRKAGDIAGARGAYSDALELNPGYVQAKLALGVMEFQEGQLDRALDIASEVQTDHPDIAGGFELQGLILVQKNQFDQAIAAYRKAYERTQNGTLARQLANAYRKAGQAEAATDAYREWLTQSPDDLETRLLLAMDLQSRGQADAAVKEYEYIYGKNQRSAVVLNNLAWLYFTRNDERALEMARKAYELDPERPEVADTYGWILLHHGNDAEQALNVLQQAYISFPTSAEIGYHVAVAQHRLGRDSAARRTLSRALEGDPDFADVEAARALLKKLGG